MSNEKYTFEEVLERLGHLYSDLPPGARGPGPDHIRHIAARISDAGEISPLCADQPRPLRKHESPLHAPQLAADSNCATCRHLRHLPQVSLTKRSVLVNCVHILMNIEQMFLDTMYWNGCIRKEVDKPINPDPDGELAKAWEVNVAQIESMISRFRLTMEKHANTFGWAEIVEADNE